MYKCKLCGKTVPPRTSSIHVVLETRPIEYPVREKVNRNMRGRDPEGAHRHDRGGKGTAIVCEALVCSECAAYTSR